MIIPHPLSNPEARLRIMKRRLEFLNKQTLKSIDRSIAGLIEMGAGPDVIDPLKRVRERHRKAFKHTIKVMQA
jgi:hypothetical protein